MLRFVTLSTDARFVFLIESMAASRFTVRVLALRKPQALPLPLLNYAEKVTRLLPSALPRRADRAPSLVSWVLFWLTSHKSGWSSRA